MTTCEMEVTFPEASLKRLRELISDRAKLLVVQNQLHKDIESVNFQLESVVQKAHEELRSLGFEEELGVYLDKLHLTKELMGPIDKLTDYGFFGEGKYLQGNVYDFLEEFIDLEMSCSSEQMPRLANLKSASFWEYNPRTQEAFMVDVLRYDDDPYGEIEYNVRFIINPMQDGPFRVNAQVVLHDS